MRRQRAVGPTPAQRLILAWLAGHGGRAVRVTMNGCWGCRLVGAGTAPVGKVRRSSFQTLKDRGWVQAGTKELGGATMRFDETDGFVRDKEHWHQDWAITPAGRSAAKRGP